MKKSIVAILVLSMLMCMTPVSGVWAAPVSSGQRTAKSGSDEAAAKGQVVVLYEEGEVDGDAPATAPEKRMARNVRKAKSFGTAMREADTADVKQAENTLGQQAEILTDTLGQDYLIEDTVVFEAEKKSEEDVVISIVSSDKYSADEMAGMLTENDKVKAAEPNYIFRASAMPDWNDTYLNESWQNGAQGVNADKAWNDPAFDSAEEPVVIAVMDTGIDYEHEDLANRMWTEPEGFKLNGNHGMDYSDMDDDPMDLNGHGTHCAGIVAAEANNAAGIAGVAGKSAKVQLMSVRVLDEDGSGYLDSIVSAFYYLIRAKKAGANIKAVNCSFGASVTSEIFDEVIDQAGENGILTIAAAGNEMSDNDSVPSAPANCKSDYVISVAALDEDGSVASYTNWGKRNVDVAAPGSNILSTVCYDNYMPFLYGADRLAATTQTYGEFSGAAVTEGTDAQGNAVTKVTPVSGTDFDGNAVTGIDGFGESVMLSDLAEGSSGSAEFELVDEAPIAAGNNTTSLRWKINNASAGDTYVLYFPYEKMATGDADTYMNIVFRTHTEPDGGMGTVAAGDVIAYVDKNGKLTYRTIASENYDGYMLPVSYDWNSIWQASGVLGAIYPHSEIKEVKNNIAAPALKAAEEDEEAADTRPEEAADQTPQVEEETPAEEPAEAAEPAEEAADDAAAEEQAEEVAEAADAEATEPEAAEETEGTAEAAEAAEPEVTASDAEPEETREEGDEPDEAEDLSGYGLGLVYTAEYDGNVYIDINSLAVAKAGVDSEKFGRYDIYSGTSMATPVVTGTIGVLAAMNPDMSAAQLRDKLYQTTHAGYSDICSTGGAVDFAHYSAEAASSKPVISSAEVDFDSRTVTLSAESCGSAPQITAEFDFAGETEEISADDITVEDGAIVIADNYGLIGSQVTFDVVNTENGLEGSRTFYLVRGLEEYEELFTGDLGNEDEGFEDDDDEDYAHSKNSNDGAYEEDEPFPADLRFVKGTGELLMYDSGFVYRLSEDDGYYPEIVGEDINTSVIRYAVKAAKTEELWAPDDPSELEAAQAALDEGDVPGLSYISTSVLSAPVCMGNTVYRMVKADMVDRTAVLLMGLDLSKKNPTWTVYFDSLADFGSTPDGLRMSSLRNTSLAGYKGKLYMLGTTFNAKGGDKVFSSEVYCCTPSTKGSEWEQAAGMPGAVEKGCAVSKGGNLYYVLGKDEDGYVNYLIYQYDGSGWTVAGTLPPALYEKGDDVIEFLGFLFEEETDSYVPCAVGIDDQGIVFGGTSFDGAGDTFRFNTETGVIEQLGYTVWGDVSDRATDGTVADGKLVVTYIGGAEEDKFIAKAIPADSGYVNLKVTVTGKGSGTVSGGGYIPKGEATDILIKPDKGSYVYQIKTKGLTKNFNKKYGKATTESMGEFRSSFKAQRNGSIEVSFGKKSTKIIAKNQTVKVGKRKLKAETDGTISGVTWKSGNSKYAKVNKNGTITFKKAGRGKTVKMTAISKEDPKIKKTIKVKIKK